MPREAGEHIKECGFAAPGPAGDENAHARMDTRGQEFEHRRRCCLARDEIAWRHWPCSKTANRYQRAVQGQRLDYSVY